MPTPKSFRRKHNARSRRLRESFRAAEKRDAARCQTMAGGVRCAGTPEKLGYCRACWKGGASL